MGEAKRRKQQQIRRAILILAGYSLIKEDGPFWETWRVQTPTGALRQRFYSEKTAWDYAFYVCKADEGTPDATERA